MIALRNWYLGLTRRERWLVTIAAALAGVVILLYGIILPLGAAHDAAHLRHREAVRQSGDILARLDVLDAAPEQRTGAAGSVAQQVAAAADAEGLVLQTNEARGDEATTIVIPAAPAGAALTLIDTLAGQGIALEALTMTPAPDGTIAVNATLRRAGA